jgi:dissimilatory sulfite reductase (desulfoviridin) alpha/beta subunit
MAYWFLRGVARGVVTTKYPKVTDSWAKGLPTPPSFVPALLSADVVQRLVESCPSRALSRQGQELIFDVGACTACGTCQRVAPEAVMSSGEFELASSSRARLLKRIPIEGDRP